jgi:hypothetical protein
MLAVWLCRRRWYFIRARSPSLISAVFRPDVLAGVRSRALRALSSSLVLVEDR